VTRRQERAGPQVELVATLLLAVAAVATAWCSYQATRWNGEQAKVSAGASAARFQAARAADLANVQTEIDVATFTQWVDAYARNESKLAEFYRARFRPEFVPAVEAWIATRPLVNPDAPLTPFRMTQYRLAASADADRLDAQAEALAAQVRRDIQRASNYVLGVVLCAVALFFAGMSTKLTSPALRTATLIVGCLVFLGTVGWVATFPVSLSV
jgi:hypothetical protein